MNALQQKIFDIFIAVKSILDKNGIDYYSIGGTCIGAVRHKGFIPWDDDLDIAVPIDRFDFMIDCLKKELPQTFKVYTCEEIQHYRYIFIKVIDITTTFIEKTEFDYPDAYKGIFIDIMPLGGIKPTGHFYKKLDFYFRLNVCKRIPAQRNSAVIKRMIWWIINNIPAQYDYFSKKYMNFLKHYNVSDSDFVGYVWSRGQRARKLTFPKEWFAETVELPFETTLIKCPVKYNLYLSKQFGDYMLLPSQEERRPHHCALIKLDIPYTFYQNNPEKVKEAYNNEE